MASKNEMLLVAWYLLKVENLNFLFLSSCKLSYNAQAMRYFQYEIVTSTTFQSLIFVLLFSISNRHVLVNLHFNENVRRKRKRKDDRTYDNVAYPKSKGVEGVAREVAVETTYGTYCIGC